MEKEQIRDIQTEIRERYPEIHFPDVYQSPLSYGRGDTRTMMDGWSTIVGDVDRPIYDVEGKISGYEKQEKVFHPAVSEQYMLTPHELTVWNVEQSLKDFDVWGPKEIEISLFKDYARIICKAKFPEAKTPIKVGDIVSPEIGVQSSIDLSHEYSPWAGMLRLACTNGMIALRAFISGSYKHRQNLDVEGITEILQSSVEGMQIQEETYKMWTNTEMPREQAEALLGVNIDAKEEDDEEIASPLPFGKRQREEILALPETTTGETVEQWMRKGSVNVWNFNNVLTQYLSHNVESEMVRLTKGEKVAKVMHKEFPYKKAA